MQKEKGKMIPIKVKLLSIIVPAVVVTMIILIGISYSISKEIILGYSSSLLNSSIENQSNEIEAWLNENLAAFQMAKNVIETTSPDEVELQNLLDGYYGKNDNCIDGEKMAIMINDRTFHVPSKGEIVLPISDTTIDSDLVEYTNNKVEEDWIIDAASGFVKTEQMENFNQIRIFAVAILFVVGVIVAIICLLVRNAKNKRI